MDNLNADQEISDEEFESDSIHKLVNGLNINDLSSTGAEFAVQINEEDALEEQCIYDGPNVVPHLNINCLGPEEDEEIEESYDGATPFEFLSKKMKQLDPNGKVMKRVLVEGFGEVVPENALVWFHHNSYIEGNDTPIDSSYLRGRMTMIRLNSGLCIMGLDIGLSTMKRDEKAEFLIHPDYAYGKLGSPPRIPENAFILISVEMKKFVDNALAIKMGEVTEEEVKTMPFEEVVKGAESLMHNAKSYFVEKKYKLAIRLYRNGLRLLENCDMKSDVDDKKNETLRLKIYTNMGVCYNKLYRSKPAIVSLRTALHISPNNAKILYNLGVAHLNIRSIDEAKKFTFLARKYAPYDPDISNLLLKIEKNTKRYNSEMVSFSKRAFKFSENSNSSLSGNGNKSPNGAHQMSSQNIGFANDVINYSSNVKIVELTDEPPKIESEEKIKISGKQVEETCESEFQNEAINYIEEFINDPKERKLPLPVGVSYEEELFFKKQAALYHLKWDEREEDRRMVVYLLK